MKPHSLKWLLLTLCLALAVHAGVARADEVVRNPTETDDAFMVRVLGGSVELAQKVVTSTELTPDKRALIGFVLTEDSDRMHLLVGHLLIETTTDRYQHLKFASCGEEGDLPALLAVFFARTAKEGGRDLAVLCSWNIKHYKTDGTAYAAEFYRLKNTGAEMTVEPLVRLNRKFNTADMDRLDDDGTRVHERARFRTVADIKKLLNKMGLRQ
jgi:hypothetical protein